MRDVQDHDRSFVRTKGDVETVDRGFVRSKGDLQDHGSRLRQDEGRPTRPWIEASFGRREAYKTVDRSFVRTKGGLQDRGSRLPQDEGRPTRPWIQASSGRRETDKTVNPSFRRIEARPTGPSTEASRPEGRPDLAHPHEVPKRREERPAAGVLSLIWGGTNPATGPAGVRAEPASATPPRRPVRLTRAPEQGEGTRRRAREVHLPLPHGELGGSPRLPSNMITCRCTSRARALRRWPAASSALRPRSDARARATD